MKKLTALLLSLAMVFALAACGGTTATPSSSAPASSAPVSSAPTEVAAGGNIGICIYKFDDNFMTVYRNQLQKVLEEKGYKVTIADGNNDQAKQTEQINTFISQKVDALIINPVQSTGFGPACVAACCVLPIALLGSMDFTWAVATGVTMKVIKARSPRK